MSKQTKVLGLNKKKLNDVLSKFNLKTTNYKHYTLALTHSTYANEQKKESNERIEFIHLVAPQDGQINPFS